MTNSAWAELGLTWPELALTVVTATGIYVAIIAFSRVFGSRQFSTSTSYDLAFTFALGSLVGRVILVRTSLLTAVIGLLTLFLLHSAAGWLHHNVQAFHRLMQNRPVLLVAHGRVLEDSLRRARTSHAEVYQQLRLAGYGSLDEVEAVILERNGAISVIRAGTRLDEQLFTEIADREKLLDVGDSR